MNIPYFFNRVTRPPGDPSRIHPALLNAIYASACCVAGGRLSSLKEYFKDQTRYYLQKALEGVDRLTHFLWASVVFGSFLTNVGHLKEAYAVLSSCAKFAVACGLDGITHLNSISDVEYRLLPPPADEDELADRVNLSHAIYMADRSLAMISGYPSVFSTSSVVLDRFPLSPDLSTPDEPNRSFESATKVSFTLLENKPRDFLSIF